jgi:hypothetical protein
MDHAEAIQMKAVERYALGDLSVSEVEGFERHFFDCSQCSEELRILSVLQENARAVFIEQNSTPSTSLASVPVSVPMVNPVVNPVGNPASNLPATERKAARAGWRFSWGALFSPAALAPAMIVLVAAVFLGYQIGESKAGGPQSLNAYPLYAASRGAETVVAIPEGAKFFTVYMDRTWDGDFASYRAVVHDDSPAGSERASLPIPVPAQGRLIQVLFPSHSLAPGRYVLSILAKDASGHETKAADYSFTLRFE